MISKMKTIIDSIIDWDKFDASSQISERMRGVTKEHIEIEVDLWERQLAILSPLNFDKIKKEIDAWDIGIPRSSFDFNVLSITYASLVGYKHRISQLMSEAKTWDNTCESAIDYILDLSQGAFTGTAAEKKANASHIVQPFVHLKNQTNRVLNYLDKIHSSIMFCAQQLDLLLKERQSQAKLNYKFSAVGEEQLSQINNKPESIEDGDDIFAQVQSTTPVKIKTR